MKAVDFNGTAIAVITDEEGKQWVSVRHVCTALGVDEEPQRKKLRKSPEFSCRHREATGPDGKNYSMFCIAAEHAHLWVAGISAAKIKPEIREQFIAFKHECANTLYNHFQQKGEDFLGIAQQLTEMRQEMKRGFDELRGVADTVFGDDKNEIQSLVEDVARIYQVDGRTVWGWVQSELDVQSYKKQNRKIINFLRKKLGKGLTLVKENT